MKKLILLVLVLAAVCFGYVFYKKNAVNNAVELDVREEVLVEPQFDMVFDSHTRILEKAELREECQNTSEIICAVETMIKCSIKPDLSNCSKDVVPEFVFMEDDNLGRPSQISYQITNMKVLDKNTLEVQTKSSCDGTWFGLCQGLVVYVIDNSKGYFRVSDVYAMD